MTKPSKNQLFYVPQVRFVASGSCWCTHHHLVA